MPQRLDLPWPRMQEFLLEVGAERDPESFSLRTMQRIAALIPFDSAILYLLDEAGAVCREALVGVDPAWNRAYLDYYSKLDNSCFSFRVAGAGLWHWDDFRHTEYVTDFVRPQRFNHSVGIKLLDAAVRLKGALALNRSECSFGFSDLEIGILNAVMPHLANLHANLYAAGQQPAPANDAFAGCWRLTPREAEVVALLCQGLNTNSIGAALVISPRTVHKHIENIFIKLGVASRQELLAKLMRTH